MQNLHQYENEFVNIERRDNINECNKSIAIFMGCDEYVVNWGSLPVSIWGFVTTHISERWNNDRFYQNTPYHNDWNWLMPVIEKISLMQIEYEDATLSDTYYPRTFGMLNEETGNRMVRFNDCAVFEAKKLIDAAWLAVVDFVKWYNYRYSPFK